MLRIIFVLFGFVALTKQTFAVTDPSSLKIKMRKMAVSTSPFCTNPITVFSTSSPTYLEMSAGPTLGTGALEPGTYPCVIMEMSDQVKITPAANDGANCTGGTEYTMDICNANFGGAFKLANGITGTCDNTDQWVAVYLSTAASDATGMSANSFVPPTSDPDGTKGFKLDGALIVTTSSASTFVFDGRGKVTGAANPCSMNPPIFGFR